MKYMPLAKEEAARCWAEMPPEKRSEDPLLADAVARRLHSWIEIASTHVESTVFYRDIVKQIGEMFGDAAKTADDGFVHEDVLALRVPELVRSGLNRLKTDGAAPPDTGTEVVNTLLRAAIASDEIGIHYGSDNVLQLRIVHKDLEAVHAISRKTMAASYYPALELVKALNDMITKMEQARAERPVNGNP